MNLVFGSRQNCLHVGNEKNNRKEETEENSDVCVFTRENKWHTIERYHNIRNEQEHVGFDAIGDPNTSEHHYRHI